jgi:phosphoglycolate phosphatase
MKRYKLAIFDLDGTLLNTLYDLADSTNFALTACGFPERTVGEVRQFVGNGIRKLIERAVLPETDAAVVEKTLATFKAHYAEHCEDKTEPYDGIIPLLDKLIEKGIAVAVVSNKIDSAVSSLCKKYFSERISISVGDREGKRKKPAPDTIFEVLSTLKIAKEDAIYIGDSEVDIETAKNAGMDCISVTWGFRDIDVLLRTWGIEYASDSSNSLKQGVFCENISVHFADTPEEIEKILL